MKTEFEIVLFYTAIIVVIGLAVWLILTSDSVDSTIKELNCKDDRGVFIHDECIIKTDNGWKRQ